MHTYVFYLFLGRIFSSNLQREQREVPEVFREFVWEASIQEFNKTIWTNRTFQEILFGKSATFFMYLYSDEQNKKLDKALDYLVIISLMCGMTSLGEFLNVYYTTAKRKFKLLF